MRLGLPPRLPAQPASARSAYGLPMAAACRKVASGELAQLRVQRGLDGFPEVLGPPSRPVLRPTVGEGGRDFDWGHAGRPFSMDFAVTPWRRDRVPGKGRRTDTWVLVQSAVGSTASLDQAPAGRLRHLRARH